MSDTPEISGTSAGAAQPPESFAALYAGQSREVFQELARAELEKGADAAALARESAQRGKPDFALAFLLAAGLPDEEKRAVYARAFERRAELTERKAREFDTRFHRPFPMLFTDAASDRALANRVREGRGFSQGSGKQLPMM